MTNPYAKYVLFCLYSLLPVLGVSQLYNPTTLDFTVVAGETIVIEMSAWETPDFVENPDVNLFDVDLGIFEGGAYPIEITVKDDAEEGSSSFNIFYEGGEKRRTKTFFTTVTIEIVESYVKVVHDYQSIGINEAATLVDVLSNDINSGTVLNVESIDLVQNGTAVVVDNAIEFTPEPDFAGMAFVHYTAVNENGTTDSGSATICILDEENAPAQGVINISTSQFKPVIILLPATQMELDPSFSIEGNIEFIGDDVIEYTPYGAFTGVEEFVVRTDNFAIQRSVFVEVLENNEQLGPIRDDQFFTSMNAPIVFDVFENDIEETEIIRVPRGLDYLGEGQFRYSPDEDYTGIETFTYLAELDGEFYRGEVEIVTNNFYPESISKFQLVTREETVLILNYTVPIEGYSFSIVEKPANGSLHSFPEFFNYRVGDEECGWVEEGHQILTYSPDRDFIGVDEFIVQYCATGGDCDDIVVEVEVIEDDAVCDCAGTDCVWPGDFNADGKVSMNDLLPLGYHFGSKGIDRPEVSSVTWIGDVSDDWGQTQMNGKDLKFLDGTGDGKINSEDLGILSENYNRYNNLVASQTLANKEFPIDLIISQETAQVGDYLTIDIIVGNEEFPALDVHGLVYTLPLSPDVVDPESITVELVEGNWLSNNSPMLDLDKQSIPGRLDIGSSRTTGRSVSGHGIVHRVGFIIIEDIDGIRGDNQNKTVDIFLEGFTISDGSGNQYAVTGASTSFELIREQREIDENENEQPNIIAFPNPARNELNIHANGNDILEQIDIFNASGQIVSSTTVRNVNQTQISLDHFNDGLYFAKVLSYKGASTIKFKVLK